MIKFEDLVKNKPVEQIREELQNDSAEFVVAVEQMSMDELNAQEAELINALNEYDKYLDEVVYELPNGAEYDGKKFNKAKIAQNVVKFINRQEVDWQYTLGMLQLVRYWENIEREDKKSVIAYKAYDSTLRILGQTKFKGVNDWLDILAINEFVSKPHDQYTIDTSYLIYLSKLHSTVLDKMQKLENPELIMESENV